MAKSTGEMLYNPYKEYKRARLESASNKARTGVSQNPFDTGGRMVGGTLTGLGKFYGNYLKGVVIDIPHAAAEGFRRAPQLYGEKPKEYGTVHDWKSGVKVGGKNFVGGMVGGVSGFFTSPVKGFMEEGPDGAMKGFARGVGGLATKMPSGEFCSSFICLGIGDRIDANAFCSCYWVDGVSVPWDFKEY